MATGAKPTLAIVHAEGSNPPAFHLTRSDGKSLAPVKILTPYEFPVEGSPQFRLMRQLRWYLEHFLDYPYHPDTIAAEHVLDALKAWGSQAFNAIFDRRDAGEWLKQAKIIQIKSDDPVVLSWPWEALFDPIAGSYVVLQSRMERQLNKLPDPPEIGKLPTDRVNILLVVARPYQNDVSYRSIARPLVDLIRTQNLPAHVDVLRPPTFDQLRAHLEEHPNYYHLLHFDGHGIYSSSRREGFLAFENNRGEEDLKTAADINALLREYAVPAIVLNACQSATLDDKSEDAFATVATALLQSGIRSVVAMAYSLTVRGAQSFLPSFYSRLFETGSIAEGVLAGREKMLSDKRRISPRGPYELEDWLLPVLYQQQPVDFIFAAQTPAQTKTEPYQSRLPLEILNHREDYKFVGRDGPILQLERALRLDRPGIVVQGLGGAGKTRLAREFLRWLDETGGLDTALWFDFRDIRSAEHVLNRTGEKFFDENFGLAPNKPELIAQALKQHRVVIVWDNFESADKNLTDEDRAQLCLLLGTIRSTKGKVIITSRSTEEWLPLPPGSKLALGGLQGEERWEYCESVLASLGLKVDRNDPQLTTLMDQLMGHPLAMRVVLPLLEQMPAEKVVVALRTNIADLGLNAEGEEGRIFATLHFVEQGLPEDLRPLLPLVSLHESFLDAEIFEVMAEQINPAWSRPMINNLTDALESAGLLRDVGNAVYELHPLLTSYLRSRGPADEACQRTFVGRMAYFAERLEPLQQHEQRVPFFFHGANFHVAQKIAVIVALDRGFGALTASMASFAEGSRDFVEASRLYRQLAKHAATLSDAVREAGAYYHLGRIDEEQRNFETAREWYLKSLKILEKQCDPQLALPYQQLGALAQKQRNFEGAREWYLKSLAINEKLGNLLGAAGIYHGLGSLAQVERNFESAREWYLKSLAVNEKQGNLHDAAITYRQLGKVAEEQHDFETAHQWYLKSLEIRERQSDLYGAAQTYHQLGILAQKHRNFETSRQWYLKSLAVNEKQGNLHDAATNYHQLGIIAQEQGDFETARQWYLKSLAIKEQQGNVYGAAITIVQLGILAGLEGQMESCAKLLTQCIKGFLQANDQHSAARDARNFSLFHSNASPEDQQKMEAIWREAGLGPLPTQDS